MMNRTNIAQRAKLAILTYPFERNFLPVQVIFLALAYTPAKWWGSSALAAGMTIIGCAIIWVQLVFLMRGGRILRWFAHRYAVCVDVPRHWLNRDPLLCVDITQCRFRAEIDMWCRENLGGAYGIVPEPTSGGFYDPTGIWFLRPADAVLFKLFWGEQIASELALNK